MAGSERASRLRVLVVFVVEDREGFLAANRGVRLAGLAARLGGGISGDLGGKQVLAENLGILLQVLVVGAAAALVLGVDAHQIV